MSWLQSAVEETSKPGGAWELLEEVLLERIATDLARSHPTLCAPAPGERMLDSELIQVRPHHPPDGRAPSAG